jgi:hypothetical protein
MVFAMTDVLPTRYVRTATAYSANGHLQKYPVIGTIIHTSIVVDKAQKSTSLLQFAAKYALANSTGAHLSAVASFYSIVLLLSCYATALLLSFYSVVVCGGQSVSAVCGCSAA